MQNDITQISVSLDGNKIDPGISIQTITIEKAANEFSTADLVLLLDAGEDAFGGTEIDDFSVGKSIEIKEESSSPPGRLFKGLISGQRIQILDGNVPALSLSCIDTFSKLNQEKKTRLFSDMKESEAIEKILSDNGINHTIEASEEQQIEIFQYQLSDWEMILRLAAKNAMFVFSGDNKLKVSSPQLGTTPSMEITYGKSILDMDIAQDTDHQYLISQPLSPPSNQGKASVSKNDATDLVKGKLSERSGLGKFDKGLSSSSKTTASRKNIQVKEEEMAQLKGRICINGTSKISPGDMLSLKGLGKMYSGKAFLQGVEHRIEEGTWISYLTVGMPDHWQEMPGSKTVSPSMNGLQRARVRKLENDPAGAYRINVQLPGMEENEGLWAKLSQFAASNNSGAFFLPEIGDEVVIGFEEASEVSPIVVGMLYNQKHSPPLAYSDKNPVKQLKTRSGHSLTFDDGEQSIEIKTSDGKRIFLNSDRILLEDDKKNKVSIDSSAGIILDSKSDIKLKAAGNINLDAKSNISLKANANVNVQGLNVSHKANAQFSASGNAGAELKTSAIAIIQGSLVKIN
ncbi:MAG: phage baseplate assembly protein V [Bacteroidia bacterium]|nr:phage baseplate assembly protein V [Bacteroidia bacterium]